MTYKTFYAPQNEAIMDGGGGRGQGICCDAFGLFSCYESAHAMMVTEEATL